MGSAVQDISNSVSNVVKQNPGAAIGAATGGVGGLTIGGTADLANNMMQPPAQPKAPGVDPQLDAARAGQQKQAADFRAGLPGMEERAGQNLAQRTNQTMGQNINSVNASDNSRGLLFGGMNQGHQGQVRAQAQTSLAQGREQINDQYNQAANQMDQAAVGTGLAVQQSQQGIQDQIYNQALNNMMRQNQAFGSLLGAGGMAGGIAAGA